MSNTVVQTTAGAVRGVNTAGALAFLGIPYAAPPTAENRWLAPAPAAPWTGVRDADAYGPSAPQPPFPPLDEIPPEPAQDEDCLVVNVWTSGTQGAKPVLVWLHGGGFSMGSGSLSWFDGTAIARRGDAVVMTINHRLGALGYLDAAAVLGADNAASNCGMLDIVAALEWIRDNAAGFGGDPSRVTIFGESGGGGKVATLLTMPAARGLFHRAAIQSGVFLDGPGERLQAPEQGAEIAHRVARSLGGAEAMRNAPVEQVLQAQIEIEREHPPGSGGAMPFWPVADGRSVSGHPLDEIASGAAAPVPLIVGSNLHETTLFLWLGNPAYRADPAGWSMPPDELERRLAGFAGARAPRLLDAYRAIHPAATDLELYVAISSDSMRLGAIRVAEAQFRAGRAPAYLYLFTWESPLGDGALGATHGLEIPFVFRTRDEHFATRGVPGAEQVADEMSSAWCSFAAGGAPVTTGCGPWPAFSLPERETMVFGQDTAVVADPRSAEREAWDL